MATIAIASFVYYTKPLENKTVPTPPGLNGIELNGIENKTVPTPTELKGKGLITFRFDDFKDNIYNLTTEYLGKYGYTCSIYVQTDLVGTPGRLTWAQLDYLYTEYHFELGSHTRSHPHLASDNLSDAQLENEIYGSLTDIESNTSEKVYTFAPPYGDYNPAALDHISKYYYGMTTSTFGFNKYPWNFYDLQIEEVRADTKVSRVENWIDEAIRDNEYLILLFHNLEDNPENYSIDPSTFISIVEYVHNHESELRVISVRDAINLDLASNVVLDSNMDNKSDSWLLNWTRSASNAAILDISNHGTIPSENSSIRFVGDNNNYFLHSDNFAIDHTKKYYLYLFTEMSDLTEGWISIKIDEFNSVGETISPGVWIRSLEKEGTWFGSGNYVGYLIATYIPSSSQVVKGNVFIYHTIPSSFTAYLDRCILTTEDLYFTLRSKSNSSVSTTPSIHIIGDIQFDNAHGANGGGTGTQLDPYIIENWAINASSAHGIWIENTTKYFIVRNCLVENGGSSYYGIYLNKVINGRIENNVSNDTDIGIYLKSSSNSTISNNICSNNIDTGISLGNSDYIILDNNNCENDSDIAIRIFSSSYENIINNNCSNNSIHSIYLISSSYDNIINNVCKNNGQEGIYLLSSSHDNLARNNCSNDSTEGISLDSSDYNVLDNNTCSNGLDIGIYLVSSSYDNLTNNICDNNFTGLHLRSSSLSNNLLKNTCENNSDTGIYLENLANSNTIALNYLLNNNHNAHDDGINYWDNGSAGNYWSDWQPPDHASSNRIVVDEPRPIEGETGQDRYPLVMTTKPTPTTTPPTRVPWALAGVGTAFIVIIAVMVLVLKGRGQRKKVLADFIFSHQLNSFSLQWHLPVVHAVVL